MKFRLVQIYLRDTMDHQDDGYIIHTDESSEVIREVLEKAIEEWHKLDCDYEDTIRAALFSLGGIMDEPETIEIEMYPNE